MVFFVSTGLHVFTIHTKLSTYLIYTLKPISINKSSESYEPSENLMEINNSTLKNIHNI